MSVRQSFVLISFSSPSINPPFLLSLDDGIQLAKNEVVMALFPEMDCFYRALVI